MATEAKKVNEAFKQGVTKVYPQAHWQRVECWTDKGIPDVNLCLSGKDHWIECKWVPSKTGIKFSHPLQPEQCAWLLARYRAGGSSWVLARRNDVFRLYPGYEARSVVDRGWSGNYCLEMQKPWDWVLLMSTVDRA